MDSGYVFSACLAARQDSRTDGSDLFIIVVSFALGYGDIFIADSVNKSVFIVDSPAPFSFWTVFQRFGLSLTGKTASRGIPPKHLPQM